MFDLRPAADDAEFAEIIAVIAQAFTTPADPSAYVDQVGRENFRGAWVDGRCVGALATFWMGHWFGGRSVPVCGVAAVGVRPDVRGTGIGGRMMQAILRESRERGVPLASLYASTQNPYRRVGYEQAGARQRYTLAIRELAPAGRPLPVELIDPSDWSRLVPLYERWARTQAGVLDRNEGIWKRVVGGQHVYAAILGDPAEGYLVWSQAKNATMFYDIHVRDRVALTPAAARQIWTLLADHRSMAATVQTPGMPHDPAFLHLEEWRTVTGTVFEPWLLRIVDVKGALEARGWPADGELELEIADADFPENAGRWRLVVEGGQGSCEPGGAGRLRMDRRGLAPLFSGAFTAGQLAAQGWIDGDPDAIRAADRLFAGPTPWMVDHF